MGRNLSGQGHWTKTVMVYHMLVTNVNAATASNAIRTA
jgi:hypothetical protein